MNRHGFASSFDFIDIMLTDTSFFSKHFLCQILPFSGKFDAFS